MASEMPVNHPLLPLVWEKFFTIYLSKHDNCLHRVGHRLFESAAQTTFLKQMKRSLCQASEHYASSASTVTYGNQLATFYHALSLWIDEPRLHDPLLNVVSLPQQYNNERLAHLFNADYRIFDIKWLELVDLRQMYETLTKFTNELWTRKRAGFENNSRSHVNPHRAIMTSSQKLVDLVSNVQRPAIQTRTVVPAAEPLTEPATVSFSNDYDALKRIFEEELAKVIQWLRGHCQRHDKQIEMDQTLMSLLPSLWKNEFQEVILITVVYADRRNEKDWSFSSFLAIHSSFVSKCAQSGASMHPSGVHHCSLQIQTTVPKCQSAFGNRAQRSQTVVNRCVSFVWHRYLPFDRFPYSNRSVSHSTIVIAVRPRRSVVGDHRHGHTTILWITICL